MTKNGFEKGIELTSKLDKTDIPNVKLIFSEIWKNSSGKRLTYELIETLYPEYLLIKKQNQNRPKNPIIFESKIDVNYEIDIFKIIEYLFKATRTILELRTIYTYLIRIKKS